jgi:hypothetical protein
MDKLEQYLDQVCRNIGGPYAMRRHVRQELREHFSSRFIIACLRLPRLGNIQASPWEVCRSVRNLTSRNMTDVVVSRNVR